MRRRQLLRTSLLGAALTATGLVVRPARAHAMGGSLPALDAPAPDFNLPGVAPGPGSGQGAAQATQLALADFAGLWLVLYFYPRDFTGGCTLEARGFQKDLKAFQRAGAAVVGVSADDPDSHASFCSEEGLAFPLLSDPGGTVSQRYGSWIAPFSQRHTFLIDPKGVIRSRWVAVRPSGHSREVLEELRRLQA
ncbi:peroxiredoxin [Cyanobium sp. ATX 6A2]|uniref:peroxiredoxin n=1 Tax=Cyanobium sp. ATX 6A2 TaxID=2823700 RepID=UPI0020CE13BD|nr:peroxiredoxin [Cyanobium sp. ATX 6A2]MCP9887286.1 peroxiredoxin [Cyanobium sp. ATX 6A2]